MRRYIIGFMSFFVFLPTALWAQVALDFDGDGTSDFYVEERKDGSGDDTLIHYAVRSSDSQVAEVTFGSVADGEKSAPGDYDGDGATDVATVKVEGRNKKNSSIVWSIRFEADNTEEVSFGQAGDAIIAGCDFDGDGKDDLGLLRGKVFFYKDYDESDLSRFAVASRRYRSLGCADTNGDGADELVGTRTEVRKIRRGNRVLNRKTGRLDVFNGAGARLVNGLRAGSVSGALVFVADVNDDGNEEWGIAKRSRAGANLFLKVGEEVEQFEIPAPNSKGNPIQIASVTVSADKESSSAGVHMKASDGKFYVYNFLNDTTTEVNLAGLGSDVRDLRVVPDVLVTKMQLGSGGNSGGGGSSGNGGGQGLSSVCRGTRGAGGGVLWKPYADAAGARDGKPVMLFTGGNKPGQGSISIYASDGTRIGSLGFKPSSIPGVNNGAEHYYSGWSGGSGDTCSGLASRARSASRNSNIYVQGRSGQCVGPIDPCSRSGNI